MDNYLFGYTDIWTHHYSFILRVFSLYCTLSYVLYSLVDVFQSKAELYLVVLHRFKTYHGEGRARWTLASSLSSFQGGHQPG